MPARSADNIANGSPIGDMPPALIALGAELTLGTATRGGRFRWRRSSWPMANRTRAPGEFVESIRIPRPAPGALVRIVKLSKRIDSDISSVCGAFALDIRDGMVGAARIAFGGMAGIPARAPKCEAALQGRRWSEATVETAARALGEDYAPLDDLRGSAAYRVAVAANLLRRLWAETGG